jgi:hypothetical protein
MCIVPPVYMTSTTFEKSACLHVREDSDVGKRDVIDGVRSTFSRLKALPRRASRTQPSEHDAECYGTKCAQAFGARHSKARWSRENCGGCLSRISAGGRIAGLCERLSATPEQLLDPLLVTVGRSWCQARASPKQKTPLSCTVHHQPAISLFADSAHLQAQEGLLSNMTASDPVSDEV